MESRDSYMRNSEKSIRISGIVFALAMLLCTMVVIVKNAYSNCLSSSIDIGLQRAVELKNIDTLYIGSSMFKQGLSPSILEKEKKDQSIFLITYNGNSPALEELEISYLIKKGCNIKRIYVDLYVYSASREPNLEDSRLLFDSDLRLKNKIWKLISSRDASITSWWEFYVLGNNEEFILWPIYHQLVSDRYYRGGIADDGDYASSGRTHNQLDALSVPIADGLNISQKEAIRGIVKMCRENNTELVFVETPKYSKVERDEGYYNLMCEYIELLDSCDVKSILLHNRIAGSLGFENCDSSHIRYYSFDNDNPGNYNDLLHLSPEGRELFTREMLNTGL